MELLTLSACETALGTLGAYGREVEGLAVVAQQQNAKAALATLWSVADASTGIFMRITNCASKKAHRSRSRAASATGFTKGAYLTARDSPKRTRTLY